MDILGRKVDYRPYKENLYNEKMVLRVHANKSFRRIFMPRFNITNKFIGDMRNVVNPEHKFRESTIWVVSGETGTGKSSVVMSLVRLILLRPNIWEMFCFTDKQMLDLAKDNPMDTFLIRDEDVRKAVFGMGSTRTAMELEVLLETCRIRGISAVFISPQEEMMGVAKYYIETVDMDIENRITRVAVKDPRTMMFLGAVYVPIIPKEDNDWVQYSAMKDAFTKRMTEGNIDDTKIDLHDCVRTVLGKLDTEVYRTRGERRLLVQECFPNYTNAEVKTIAMLLEMKLRQDKQDGE